MSNLRTVARWARVPGLAVLLATVGLGGSASAAVTDLEVRSQVSATNSSNKSVGVPCSPGKRVVGAGATVVGGSGQVLLSEIRPNAALTDVTVGAVEDENGVAASWSVTAYAICAPPPPGLQRVGATSASSSSNKEVTASCPAGKRVLGTGGAVNSSGGQVLLDDLRPNSALTGVTVHGSEDETGKATSWSLSAVAICSNPVAGLKREVVTSPLDSNNKGVTAVCPAGKQLVGAGGDIATGNGQVLLAGIIPTGSLTGATANAVEDETGNAANWRVSAYAICADSSELVVATSPSDSNSSKSVTASCPAGKQVTGAGGDISGGLGQVVIDDLSPSSSSVLVTGFEDETGHAGNWSLRAYAICSAPRRAWLASSARAPPTPPTRPRSRPVPPANRRWEPEARSAGVGGR